ncbi:ShlB/FhaC/HecB family hemolysin secretion/activation protein [Burkholderia ubonensis]|uniref:ShlB/FhaC/HecB family hemolysin secretion/activation protein n=1 Tax=Burkholderia ubonensis TaxID=101571 RepID=UPI0012F9FE02|nr:ShlB/FhaC/HecB family hemolysin secretion/activation protein [Burkholderia ubonensis]
MLYEVAMTRNNKCLAIFFVTTSAALAPLSLLAQVPSGLIINSLPLPKTPNQKPDATEDDVIIGNPAAALKGLAGKLDQARISGFSSDIDNDVDGYNAIKPYLYKQVSGEEWDNISRDIFNSYASRGRLIRADLEIESDGRATVSVSELKLISINVASPGFKDSEIADVKSKFEGMFKIGESIDLKKLKSELSVADYRGKAMITTKFLQINADGVELKIRIEPRRLDKIDRWAVGVDNYGLSGFGRARLTASYSAPLFSVSDNLGIKATLSRGLQNISGRYDFPIPGRLPLKGSIWASALKYSAAVDDVRQRGNAALAGVDLNYPYFMWNGSQILWGVGYEYKHSRDSVVGIDTTRKSINNFHARATGAGFFERRLSFNADLTVGSLGVNGRRAALQDKYTAKSIGAFQKFTGNVSFVQPITARSDLSISVDGQLSSGNLDSLEKMYFGGDSGVRAYDNTISGDQGIIVRVDYMYAMNLGFAPIKFGVFSDYAVGQISHSPWEGEFSEGQSNVFHLSDIGLQISGAFKKVSLSANLSHPIGRSSVDRDQGWRVWVGLRTSF